MLLNLVNCNSKWENNIYLKRPNRYASCLLAPYKIKTTHVWKFQPLGNCGAVGEFSRTICGQGPKVGAKWKELGFGCPQNVKSGGFKLGMSNNWPSLTCWIIGYVTFACHPSEAKLSMGYQGMQEKVPSVGKLLINAQPSEEEKLFTIKPAEKAVLRYDGEVVDFFIFNWSKGAFACIS